MQKLVLIALAAGAAALPTGAFAQVAHTTVSQGGNVMMHPGGGAFMHPGANFQHHRFQRGAFIPPFWFGPQFHVQNWQLYGFAAPPAGHRWVRYYDDAYLVDGQGRVQDTRTGLDWDEYGERWTSEQGIPAYHGSGEWRPDERDYSWVEGNPPGAMAGAAYGPGQGCQPSPYPCGGYGQGYGYYGYGVAYPIIIETTVTSGGGCCASNCCYEEVVTEEVVEVRQPPRRYHRPQPRPRPRPRPPAGERG